MYGKWVYDHFSTKNIYGISNQPHIGEYSDEQHLHDPHKCPFWANIHDHWRSSMSQSNFGLSVRIRLTLPKVGTWSPLGRLKTQN
jgi:hypothetical protein